MNYIDLILILLLIWSAYKGFSKGLIIQAASLAALILGIIGAIKFSGFTSNILIEKFDANSQHLPLISFAVTFLAIVIGIHIMARILDKLATAIALGFLNRLLGVIFGIIKTAFIISIILVILNGINKKINILPKKTIEKSMLYGPLSKFAPKIFPYLNFDNIRNNTQEKIDESKSFIET